MIDTEIKNPKLNLAYLQKLAAKPELFAKGNAVLWDDDHISQHMLAAHLDPDSDAASRRDSVIESTLNWISGNFLKPSSDILDLGCGPGLYTKRLAAQGHRVVGIDFSRRSIEYAQQDAQANRLKIRYLYQNYLTMDYAGEFDLILMIYCDFGVLNDEERHTLLTKVHKALRPGGRFIFDVFNEKYVQAKPTQDTSWTIEENGFWSKGRYLALTQSFSYPEANAFAEQYIILTENEDIRTYHNWTHAYDKHTLTALLTQFHFTNPSYYDHIIDSSNFTSADVTFVVAQKETQ